MTFGKYPAHGSSMWFKNTKKFSRNVCIAPAGLAHNSGRSASKMCLKVAYVVEGGGPAR